MPSIWQAAQSARQKKAKDELCANRKHTVDLCYLVSEQAGNSTMFST